MKTWKLLAVFGALALPTFARGQTVSPAEAMTLEQQGKLPEAAA
jgi:hypothetical protein